MPFIMLPAISRYRALYPEVTIELTLSQRMPDLFEGNANVAVIGAPTLPDSELVSLLLGMIFVILCAAPTCVCAHGASQEPGDLAHHECLILHTLVVPPHEQVLDGPNSSEMMEVNGPVHVNIADIIDRDDSRGHGAVLCRYFGIERWQVGAAAIYTVKDERLCVVFIAQVH
jgi:DNA-binding transcriptional LysR family regulator